MSFLRRANKVETIRIEHPEADAWVELRKELSKGEMNRVALVAPTEDKDRAGMITLTEKLAEIVIYAWSMTDENGNPVPFSLAEYKNLTFEAAQWLDSVLGEHLQKVLGTEVKEIEGKPSN